MATNAAINQGDSTRIFSGIQSWGGSGNYFDDTTLGSFTLLRAGTGYVKGKPVSWAGSQTVTGLAAGTLYWICIDSTGTLVKFDAFGTAIFTDNIPLFECLRDSTSPTNNQYTVREDHPYWVEANTSVFLHNAIGPIIRNTNNGANITISGTQKIQIVGADYLEDHGLTTTISDSGGSAVTFRKVFTNGSGKWCTYNSTDTFTGHYNSSGTVTALGSSKFGVYTLYVSKDTITSSSPTYYAVLDNSQYNNQVAANSSIAAGSNARASNELYNLELAQLGYIIYSEATSSIVEVIISKSTLKQTLSTSGSNIANLISTVVTNFDGILSSADTNVQAALETIDDLGKSGVGATALYATTFDTNVAAAKLQMAGTTITATGSDTNVGMTITPKGTGALTLTTGNVAISSGNLGLPTTSSTIGQITINGSAWAHAYGTNNIFIGRAGNFTLDTTYAYSSIGIGYNSLSGLTGTTGSEGAFNTCVGDSSGQSITTGQHNCCLGRYACQSGATTGICNTILGSGSGNTLETSDSSNILIGYTTAGIAGESNNLIIGKATGTGNGEIVKTIIRGISGKTSTSGAAVYVNSSDVLGTSTSSIRYKEDVTDMSDMSQICASLRPVTFHFKEDTTPKPLQYGLIAEEVEAVWPDMVIYGPDGLPQNLSYNFLAPMLLKEVQKLNVIITDLTNRIIALENK